MLQEFIVWAESKTIEAAAKEMHISQSTLSKHLIALETELGISLINRHDKGRLTPAGVRFYNGIVDVVERLNKTVEESRQIAEKTDYEIIVWDPYVFSGAMRELERIMHAFSKECSVPFHFTLRNEAYKTPGESLAEGLVDVAIGYHPSGGGRGASGIDRIRSDGRAACTVVQEGASACAEGAAVPRRPQRRAHHV